MPLHIPSAEESTAFLSLQLHLLFWEHPGCPACEAKPRAKLSRVPTSRSPMCQYLLLQLRQLIVAPLWTEQTATPVIPRSASDEESRRRWPETTRRSALFGRPASSDCPCAVVGLRALPVFAL